MKICFYLTLWVIKLNGSWKGLKIFLNYMKSAYVHKALDICIINIYIINTSDCCCEHTSRALCTTGCPLCRSSWQGSVGLCPVWWSWIVLWWCVPYQTKDTEIDWKFFSWYSLLKVMNGINRGLLALHLTYLSDTAMFQTVLKL